MAPLVVIRAGAKEVEYRDPRAPWKRRVESLLRDGGSEDDEDGASSSGNSDADDASESDDGDAQQRLQKLSIYGMSTELLAHSAMRLFRCAQCANAVADRDDVIAKSFFGRSGKAYLMNAMFNVRTGAPRNRYLMTGMHTICDVSCKNCETVLGWKYIRAMESSQKYKEGKYIMERAVVEDDDEESGLAPAYH